MKKLYNEISNLNETASQLFFSDDPIYKNWDYRCLAPDSDKDPEKWRSYDMSAFRTAYSNETLQNVATYKYDKNFNNWRDLNVLKNFVNEPRKAWKETYGLPYASPVPMSWKVNKTVGNLQNPDIHNMMHSLGKGYISRKAVTKHLKIFIDLIDSSKCHLKCARLVSSLIYKPKEDKIVSS